MAMTHEGRLIGRDVTVYAIDGTSALALAESFEISINTDNAQLTALKDNGHVFRTTHYGWTMRMSAFKPADPGGLGVGQQYLSQFQGLGKLPLRFVEADTGTAYEGWVLLSSWRTACATDAQKEEVELQGTGDIKIGASSSNGTSDELSDYDAWTIATYGEDF